MQVFKRITDIYHSKDGIKPTTLIVFISVFFVLGCNISFFRSVLAIFPITSQNIVFLLSLLVGFTALLTFIFTLITSKYTIKPILLIFLLMSSLTAYFMDTYNVVIDDEMIRSAIATNWAETADLINWRMIFYFLFLGVFPSLLVYRVKLISPPLVKSVLSKILTCAFSITIVIAMIFTCSRHYTSFFREHKPLRYYTNPAYYIYSMGKFVTNTFSSHEKEIVTLGMDAKVTKGISDNPKRPKLVVLVVGEAARADHFSLNGYEKETNPLLQKENIINFSEMYSCGTSTAYSVPCMFSNFTREEYSPQKGESYENILDVLTHTNAIKVLWRDNNSDSKGVALRVQYEDFKTPATNPICTDGECRDEGMLQGLGKFVAQNSAKDLLIVLHQMGNHGPAYYKRYPREFEFFQPVCKTNQLEECSQEEITNAYDNAVLYTDYFLAKTISFLREYETSHNTAMLYYSDHGESLGENNIYLHGLPYLFAPDSQTHIASFMWFGKGMTDTLDLTSISERKDWQYSHDNLFHTLLGIFKVDTELYNSNLDLVSSPPENNRLIDSNNLVSLR